MKMTKSLQKFFILIIVSFGLPAFAADVKSAPTPMKPSEQGANKDVVQSYEPSVPLNIPLFSSRFADVPVAVVDEEPISVRELADAVAGAHEKESAEKAAGKKKYGAILNRLVTVKLIAHEARNMGMDELPEIKETIDKYARQTLREQLEDRAMERAAPNESVVEAIYREIVKEFKIKSILFEKEEAANKASEELKKGADFDETIKKFVESKEAKAAVEADYVKRGGLLPEVERTVSGMKAGAVSPVVRIEQGFVILKLEDTRLPQKDDSAAHEEARKESLREERTKALLEFKRGLLKKYIKIKEKLFASLDYESKESVFDKYLKDDRTIAEIKGEKPLTVGEFTAALKPKLYHGVKAAFEGKSINEKKLPVLNEILTSRIELKEAFATGLDKTDEYRIAMKQKEDALFFSKFIEKAILPDIKVNDADIKAYYESHKKEYTRVRMLKMSRMAFKAKDRAEQALARLRKGTDFKWLKANADGVVTDSEEPVYSSVPMLVSSMPEALRKEVERAKPGDFRLYGDRNGLYYVVLVTEEVPETAQPLEEVSQKIRMRVTNDQVAKSIEEWAVKLRGAYTVKVYLSENEK